MPSPTRRRCALAAARLSGPRLPCAQRRRRPWRCAYRRWPGRARTWCSPARSWPARAPGAAARRRSRRRRRRAARSPAQRPPSILPLVLSWSVPSRLLHLGYFPRAAVIHEMDKSRRLAILLLAHHHGLAEFAGAALQREADEALAHPAPLVGRHALEELGELRLHVGREAVEHRRGVALLGRADER